MTPTTLRRTLRWVHIAAAAVIGTYLYSPWAGTAVLSIATLWIAFPAMAATGVLMWQQRWLSRLAHARR